MRVSYSSLQPQVSSLTAGGAGARLAPIRRGTRIDTGVCNSHD